MAEIKSQEKPNSLEKSHDKKERELVIRRVAFEGQVAELTDRLGRWSSEFPRQVACAKPKNEMERRLTHSGSAGGC